MPNTDLFAPDDSLHEEIVETANANGRLLEVPTRFNSGFIEREGIWFHDLVKRDPPPSPLGGLSDFNVSETGALSNKDTDDVRYDLISPIGLEAVARTYAEGAAKYGDHNWEKGTTVSEHLNRAVRHIFLYLSGDRSEDHLGHLGWRAIAAKHSEILWPHLNSDLRGPGCTPPVEQMYTKA